LHVLSFGQSWQSVTESDVYASEPTEPQIRATHALYFSLNFDDYYSTLLNAESDEVINLPTADGSFIQFRLQESQLMPEALQENFPGIKTFNAIPLEGGNTRGKVEISHKGIRAIVFQPGEYTLYIDPVFKSSREHYVVYTRNNFISDESFYCEVTSNELEHRSGSAKAGEPYNNCELKTYRLAVAATGEYTIYHGGEVEDALAAMVTTMNRVSGVYERDFGVTFTLIENIEEIIYTDPDTDPYSNGVTGAMIGENQDNVDEVIGSENYDVGHIFGTNSGGLAGLGVICNNGQKARGVTGSANPVNDPFDIDYVAHELGHQFGANHTQNNPCNSVPGRSVEPGSASTIMGYAGICPPNVQNNSDDHFHGISMEEIGIEIESNGCQVTTEIPNIAPIIQDLPETIYIPVSTPFSLAADATDLDGDTLTYCWEQMDPEPSEQPPLPTSLVGPNFRSNSPTEDSVRYFPGLAFIVSGGPFTWEVLPSVERQMSFRVTVRDNSGTAGCTQYEDVEIQTVGDAGPFEVIYPSDNGIVWQAFSQETVLWDVANTAASPINAENVNIWLSVNNGFDYPYLLAEDVPNTGSFAVQVPNVETSSARIMVQNSAGTFFDISDNNFDIEAIENGFFFESSFDGATLCQDESTSFDVDLVEVGSFPELVDISLSLQPENAGISLSENEVAVGQSFTVSIENLTGTPADEYILTVSGNAAGFENELSFPITVLSSQPSPSIPQSPENESIGVPTTVNLLWEESTEPGISYTVDLATDEDFTSIVSSVSDLESGNLEVGGLESDTEYFWRVSNQNACSSSAFSETYSFKTFVCIADVPDLLPVEIPGDAPGTIESELIVDEAGLIADIDVMDVEGNHTAVSDLIFTLEAPDGTRATLASTLCGLSLTMEEDGSVVVNSPAEIAGSYSSSGEADWSGSIPAAGITAQGILAEDADDEINDLCEPAVNAEQLAGNIAIIDRGNCTFVQKVQYAQDAGAVAAIIINNIPNGGFFDMGGTSNSIDIPAVMITYEDGQLLASETDTGAEDFFLSFDDDAPEGSVSCPPTDGGVYQPFEALSVFEGMNAQGTWKLEIEDTQEGNGGQLTNWSLNICFTGDDISSTTDVLASDVVLFPNPTSGSLIVDLGKYQAERAMLMDLSGRIIESRVVQSQRLEFNLSGYANGLYFVRLEGSGSGAVYKVVKGE